MTVDKATVDGVEDALRERAVRQLKKRRDFHAHLLVYALVNAVIVAIWFVTMAGGFFWPIFPMLGWGIGVVMNAWDVYHAEDFSDEQIAQEVARLRSR
jgi:hypothetical protein